MCVSLEDLQNQWRSLRLYVTINDAPNANDARQAYDRLKEARAIDQVQDIRMKCPTFTYVIHINILICWYIKTFSAFQSWKHGIGKKKYLRELWKWRLHEYTGGLSSRWIYTLNTHISNVFLVLKWTSVKFSNRFYSTSMVVIQFVRPKIQVVSVYFLR